MLKSTPKMVMNAAPFADETEELDLLLDVQHSTREEQN